MFGGVGTLLWTCRTGKIKSSLQKCIKGRTIYTSTNNILFSQPTFESHPHLMKNGEITPYLKAEVYISRRNKFLTVLQERASTSKDNGVSNLVLIPSASVTYMSENIPYPFRQQSDFLYLCGFKEPNSVLVMTSVLKTRQNESILFVPKPTDISERWEGAKMSLEDTTKFLGVDRTLYIDDLETFLQLYAKSNEKFTVWYDFSSPSFAQVHNTVHSLTEAYTNFISESPKSYIHKCRLIKCEYEVELMRKTCRIGAESMKEVIKMSKPSVLESHLQAKMEYECRIRGADHPSFPPVVAGGSRANTIHYSDNNQVVNNGDMILIDAGCEYGGYCSDLARTWPVNGKFTNPQLELYDLVLSTQKHLIELCKEKPCLDYLFKVMCDELGKGLQTLEIISKNIDKESLAKAAFNFCPHHVSHYLGMDVHDTSLISRRINFLPGMVVTVEPGIYISATNVTVPEKYRGICIRIEDDVLITENGVEVLTSACPKDPEDIEKLIEY